MTLSGRIRQAENLRRCHTCGLSIARIRGNLIATLDLIRARLPHTEAEQVIEELKGIWIHD